MTTLQQTLRTHLEKALNAFDDQPEVIDHIMTQVAENTCTDMLSVDHEWKWHSLSEAMSLTDYAGFRQFVKNLINGGDVYHIICWTNDMVDIDMVYACCEINGRYQIVPVIRN